MAGACGFHPAGARSRFDKRFRARAVHLQPVLTVPALHRRFLSASYYALWGSLFAVLILHGLPGVWSDLAGARVKWPHPFASADASFTELVGTPDGAERCEDALSRLPIDRPILFICRKGDLRWDVVHALMSSLSCPRDLRQENLDQAEVQQRLESINHSAYAAIVFCGVEPPRGFTRGWWINRQLVIVPLGPSQ